MNNQQTAKYYMLFYLFLGKINGGWFLIDQTCYWYKIGAPDKPCRGAYGC